MESSEHTRSMLKNIRKIKREQLLEQESINNENDAQEGIKPNDQDYQTEIKKFKTQISPRVEVTTYLIYPETKNVVFGGKFNDITEFSFEMSLSEKDGLYINTNNLQITDDIVTRIQKLNGYYKNWADEWSNKVISEYK